MDAATGTLLGAVAGGSIGLIGNWLQARNAREAARLTADNAARMQLEKLQHDARLGEIAFLRGKLEELHQAVARATAYYTLTVAIFRSADTPALKQQLDRYNEDMNNIHRALTIAMLYFDNLTETVNKLIGFIEDALHTHRGYLSADVHAEFFQQRTDDMMALERDLNDIRSEFSEKIKKEVARLSVLEPEAANALGAD
jgi:hypothetical protein